MESITGGAGQVTSPDVSWRRGVIAILAMVSACFLITGVLAFCLGPRDVFRPVLLANAFVCAMSCAVSVVGLALIVRSRRATFRLVPMLGLFPLLCWPFVVSANCLFCRALGSPAKATRWSVGGFFAAFLLMVAFVEATTMRWYWNECSRTGRIDLDKGLLDFAAPGPECSRSAPTWLRPGPVGIGTVAVGFLSVMAFIRLTGFVALDGSLMLGVLLVLFAGVMLGLLWPQSAGMLIRIIRWERTTGRRMSIALPKDREEPKAAS